MKLRLIIGTILFSFITQAGLKAQTLDPGFGTGGRVRTIVAGKVQAIARQNDGKIITAGTSYLDISNHFQLMRFNADGKVDSTFGLNGVVQTPISFMSAAEAIAIQPDGKILVGGTYQTGDFANIYHFVITRYKADGTPDSTFGTNGLVMPESGFTDELTDMVLQSDGKIIMGGAISNLPNTNVTSFLLARFNSNGTPDAGFGTGGSTVTSINTTSEIRDISLLTDGSIIAAGQSGLYDSPNPDYRNFAIAKYNAQGNLDASFGTNGFVETDVVTGAADFLQSMTVQPDGKIIAAGSFAANHYLVRYQSNGSIDNTFGTNGKSVRTSLPGTLELTLRNDNKILTTVSINGNGPSTDFMMNSYLPNGSTDATFGTNGTLLTDFPSAIPEGSNDLSGCMLITPDGKMVVAGTSEGSIALVRYNAMGETAIKDPSFNKLDLSVYPNPFEGVLNLRLNNISGSVPVTVVLNNILGQQLFSTKTILKESGTVIKLPNLIPGNYILSVTTDNGEHLIRKITKK
ncbi:T9SS type A sorting domain-containing protein [Taibaiella lutea]|uniref:T9SS type A sorting domain-containing protein n=1 Tax=Taibaiella lutea TaxID=2608001 RepID=A0A5M6CPB7_9BACT|nr:T9SS type A sorting domain-containing protein [Taibaiella lutea]KAA5536947.1 T9SS type A sorting domain-containing protein [Taibaiella lutea]